MSKIKIVTHPDSLTIMKSWQDEANITGQQYVERPFWYENKESGQTYYDLYACIGWPSEVSDKDEGLPGYAAVIGVVRPKTEGKPVKDAVFQLLTEIENKDVPSLLDGILVMREEYGFGIYPGLLQTLFGDPDRFITTLALLNERLMFGKSSKVAILVSPPSDFYGSKAFDHYVRSMRSTIMPDRIRFYFGKNDILKSRLREFRQGDPAVYAIGGLVHSLLGQTMWMDHTRENMFVVDGDNI
jgi:hypothetical protein